MSTQTSETTRYYPILRQPTPVPSWGRVKICINGLSVEELIRGLEETFQTRVRFASNRTSLGEIAIVYCGEIHETRFHRNFNGTVLSVLSRSPSDSALLEGGRADLTLCVAQDHTSVLQVSSWEKRPSNAQRDQLIGRLINQGIHMQRVRKARELIVDDYNAKIKLLEEHLQQGQALLADIAKSDDAYAEVLTQDLINLDIQGIHEVVLELEGYIAQGKEAALDLKSGAGRLLKEYEDLTQNYITQTWANRQRSLVERSSEAARQSEGVSRVFVIAGVNHLFALGSETALEPLLAQHFLSTEPPPYLSLYGEAAPAGAEQQMETAFTPLTVIDFERMPKRFGIHSLIRVYRQKLAALDVWEEPVAPFPDPTDFIARANSLLSERGLGSRPAAE
ncbi:MAG: hypothetical protein RL235_535 [Chlamydiota bacterium]|jgi:hypothetical protein